MVLNNALGLPWPTIRFFLDIKATTKTRKQPFLLFAYRKSEVSSLLKSETFLTIYEQKTWNIWQKP